MVAILATVFDTSALFEVCSTCRLNFANAVLLLYVFYKHGAIPVGFVGRLFILCRVCYIVTIGFALPSANRGKQALGEFERLWCTNNKGNEMK